MEEEEKNDTKHKAQEGPNWDGAQIPIQQSQRQEKVNENEKKGTKKNHFWFAGEKQYATATRDG